MRVGTGTAAALRPLACWTSFVPQPFWAKTVAVSRAMSGSLGRVKRVSDAVVLCVSWPLTGTVPCPL